jgi:putative flippase GtrA
MRELVAKLRRITLFRYLFVGGCSYVIELSSLLAMVHLGRLSTAAATAIAYWIGLIIAFTLQKFIAFQDYRRELKILTKQGSIFAVLTLWNWVFTVMFVDLFPTEQIIWTRTIALIIMSGWNFIIYKRLIFTDGQKPSSENK